MGFVLPANTRQNMETGLVPLTSVRFAIARSMQDRTNASLWINPCYSGYGRGMYDAGQVCWCMIDVFVITPITNVLFSRATAHCTSLLHPRHAQQTTTCA